MMRRRRRAQSLTWYDWTLLAESTSEKSVYRFEMACFAVRVSETISTGWPQSTESSLKKSLKKKATKVDGVWLRPPRKRKRRIKAKGDMRKHSPPLTLMLKLPFSLAPRA